MKETKLEIPADCEVDKIETQDGHIVVTFREKERKLPKSWDEFMTMFPMKVPYIFAIRPNTDLDPTQDYLIPYHNRLVEVMEEFTGDRATAEAVLALCKLIQLRNCYNGDFVPDWGKLEEGKPIISLFCGEFERDSVARVGSMFYFKTEELRDEFLRCFRTLIEKLKPLYGIKEGGEK